MAPRASGVTVFLGQPKRCPPLLRDHVGWGGGHPVPWTPAPSKWNSGHGTHPAHAFAPQNTDHSSPHLIIGSGNHALFGDVCSRQDTTGAFGVHASPSSLHPGNAAAPGPGPGPGPRKISVEDHLALVDFNKIPVCLRDTTVFAAQQEGSAVNLRLHPVLGGMGLRGEGCGGGGGAV